MLQTAAALRFMDPIMLEVCRLVRRKWQRVARGLARRRYNWRSEHYGFKLYARTGNQGRLCAYTFTDALGPDSRMIPTLVNERTTITGGALVTGARLCTSTSGRGYAAYILIHKQIKQLMAEWQRRLYVSSARLRPRRPNPGRLLARGPEKIRALFRA